MNSGSRQSNTPFDTLDHHQEEFNRSKVYNKNPNEMSEQVMLKNLYKNQLDDIMNQKNKHKMMERQMQQQERRAYNQRLRLGKEAERIKDLSYKNYYQMLMNNQQAIKKNYVSPFQQLDYKKQQLINQGVQQGKIKSDVQYQREQRRLQNMKRNYQQFLSHQVSEKQQNQMRSVQQKYKSNQKIRNVLLSPHELHQMERQKKLYQMQKYKQDLDKLKYQKYNITQSQINPQTQFSPMRETSAKQQKYNPLLNPLPYHIQNPYILKQMQKQAILRNNSYQTLNEDYNNNRSNTKKNIFG